MTEIERIERITSPRTSLSNIMSTARRRGPAADKTSPGLPESDNNYQQYLQPDQKENVGGFERKLANLINVEEVERDSRDWNFITREFTRVRFDFTNIMRKVTIIFHFIRALNRLYI